MKGYILLKVSLEDEYEYKDWFYVTIKTCHLVPISNEVFNERFALFQSSKFVILKITSCDDKNKFFTEINDAKDIWQRERRDWKVGETVVDNAQTKIFKTMKALRHYLRYERNIFERNHNPFSGWIYQYDHYGFLCQKYYKKNNTTLKEIEFSFNTNEITERNFKKNTTTITNKENQLLYTFPFIRTVLSQITQIIIRKSIRRRAEIETLAVWYKKDGQLTEKQRYNHKKLKREWNGIIFSDWLNIQGVYWREKFISNNLQKWYQTPPNFINRKNKTSVF
jgi:hypothetical protein